GRAAKTTIVRNNQRRDLSVTLPETGWADVLFDGDRLRDRLGDLNNSLRSFNFDFDLPGGVAGRRQLGVTVEELPAQLATYFGAKEGVLVASVADDSAAARAGIKAGDVIVSVNGVAVHSRTDLVRGIREAEGKDQRDINIGIVRDKKERSVVARL